MPDPGSYLVVLSADFMNTIYDRGQAYGGLLRVDPRRGEHSYAAPLAPSHIKTIKLLIGQLRCWIAARRG